MERHNCFLLVTTATCAAVGIASYLTMPVPSPDYPVPMEIYLVVTTSALFQLACCLTGMAIHVCILLQWLPPHELFSYDSVFIHWVFTVDVLGLASAGVVLVYTEHHLQSCRAVCRIRCQLSSWLAMAMAALSIVDALVLRWATRRTHCAAKAGQGLHTADLPA